MDIKPRRKSMFSALLPDYTSNQTIGEDTGAPIIAAPKSPNVSVASGSGAKPPRIFVDTNQEPKSQKSPLFSPVGGEASPKLLQANRVAKIIGRLDQEASKASSDRLSKNISKADLKYVAELSTGMDQVALDLTRRQKEEGATRRRSFASIIAAPFSTSFATSSLPSSTGATAAAHEAANKRLPAKSDLKPPTQAAINAVILSPLVGVSLTRIVTLFSPEKSRNLSTTRAIAEIINPMTETTLLARYLTSQTSSAVRPAADAYVIHDANEPIGDLFDGLLVSSIGLDAFLHIPEFCSGQPQDYLLMKDIGKVVVVVSDMRMSAFSNMATSLHVYQCLVNGVNLTLSMPKRNQDTLVALMSSESFTGELIDEMFKLINYTLPKSNAQLPLVDEVYDVGVYKIKGKVESLIKAYIIAVGSGALEVCFRARTKRAEGGGRTHLTHNMLSSCRNFRVILRIRRTSTTL